MPLRGDIARLADLKARVREMPKTVAVSVAGRAAPALTTLARSAYDGGRTVYGDARPLGKDGQALTLRKSGATEADVRFVALGTVVRAVLGTKWAKYLVGKYKILPPGRAAMPVGWSAKLDALVKETKAPQ